MTNVLIDLIVKDSHLANIDEDFKKFSKADLSDEESPLLGDLIHFVALLCRWGRHDMLTNFMDHLDLTRTSLLAILCIVRTSFAHCDLIEGWAPLVVRSYNYFKKQGVDVNGEFFGLTKHVDQTLLI